MRFRTFALASLGVAFGATAAFADTTIRWLHLSNDDAGTMELYNKIIHDFEAQNKGVKVELQDLENEAFKAKLPTMLQSDKDRPNIFYSWGRRDARAGEGRLPSGHKRRGCAVGEHDLADRGGGVSGRRQNLRYSPEHRRGCLLL